MAEAPRARAKCAPSDEDKTQIESYDGDKKMLMDGDLFMLMLMTVAPAPAARRTRHLRREIITRRSPRPAGVGLKRGLRRSYSQMPYGPKRFGVPSV